MRPTWPISTGFSRTAATRFEKADICDGAAVQGIFERHDPDAVMHLAAESHVDRSIDGPAASSRPISSALHAARGGAATSREAPRRAQAASAFITFRPTKSSARSAPRAFHEDTPYRAEFALFRLEGQFRPSGARLAPHLRPADVMTNCSNNYGPYHFPEKLIPLMIINALEGKPLPVYGARRERARLAVCRGSRRGADDGGASAARSARPTMSAAATNDATSTSSRRSAPPRRTAPDAAAGRARG